MYFLWRDRDLLSRFFASDHRFRSYPNNFKRLVAVCQFSVSVELKNKALLIVGNILLLRCCPLKGNVRIEMATRSQFTMFLSILTDCFVDVRNLFVRACYYQGILSFDSELTVEVCDRLASIKHVHFTYGSQFFQFAETLLWGTTHDLDCFSIIRIDLALHASQRDTFQTRFRFQNAQRVGGFDAANLPSVPREDDPCTMIFSQMQKALHLLARNHAGFIHNQNAPRQHAL